jgi:hypothetical protein
VPELSPVDIIVRFHRKSLGQEKKGARMMPDPVLLFATVIVLLPMGYCLLAAPAFLLVRLDIPPVTQLLRGLFNVYFLLLAIAGVIGMVAFAVEGRLVGAVGLGLIAAFAVLTRRWFLRRMDADLDARDAGDPDAVRRLRRLHWGGMLYNAVELVAIVGSIPYIVVAPA